MQRTRILLFIMLALLTTPILADDAAPIGTSVTPSTAAIVPVIDTTQQKNFLGIDYSGYIEGSYNYLLRSNQFISGDQDRSFDLNQNGLTLQEAALTLSKQPAEGLGGLANVILGRDANSIAPLGINAQSLFNSENLGFTPLQAYLQYATPRFTIMAGQFLAILGAEQVNPTQDATFSRSILFYATPSTNMGIRGVFSANPNLKITIGVNDGWDNITDLSRRKTLELGASYLLNPIFTFSLEGLSGQERAAFGAPSGPLGQRSIIDFVANITINTKLSLAANYDYAWQTQGFMANGDLGRVEWQGIAGYATYKFNDLWQTTLRAEVFDDKNGFVTGVRQNWREITLSLGYTPLHNLEIRGETRHDFSDVNAFLDTNRINTNNNNQSYALEGSYQF